MTEIEQAIIKTLAYADVFGQVLTTGELWRYLVGMRISESELEAFGKRTGVSVQRSDDYWALGGREKLFEVKGQQLRTTNQKLQTVRRWRWVFHLVPWVKLVAVSGSVAGGSPKIDDDIDLVVVTVKNRLWLSRLLLVGILSVFGKRRHPTDDPGQVNNKFCLNMWLTEDWLVSADQDLYVAHELAQLVPIVNRDGMYEQYLEANSWIGEILPNFYERVRDCESARVQTEGDAFPLSPFPFLLNWLDSQLEKWQMGRMRPRTKETVAEGLLMFHPKDYRGEVLQKYKKRLEELGISD